MPTKSSASMNSDERLELARWLIDRHDRLRAAAESRAATVVSADALLFAGATFMLDKFLSASAEYSPPATIVLVVSFSATLILVALSIVYAANAIVFVWKTTRDATNVANLPPLPFFHPPDTEKAFKDFNDFEKGFLNSSKEEMNRRALGELSLIISIHNKRYQSLKKAIRLLLISLVPFSVSIVISLIGFF